MSSRSNLEAALWAIPARVPLGRILTGWRSSRGLDPKIMRFEIEFGPPEDKRGF